MKPFVLAILLMSNMLAPTHAQDSLAGTWTVSLAVGKHHLPFGVELKQNGKDLGAHLVNGNERIPVPSVVLDNDKLMLDISHYDSKLILKADRDNAQFVGLWVKRRGKDNLANVPATMRRQSQPNWQAPNRFLGRWSVDFEGDDDPAVAIFKKDPNSNRIDGTFLTTTGDYRFLSGGVENGTLTLSCFDGAHAFLFSIESSDDGKIVGEFFSGNWFHTTFSGRRDANANLPDAFQQTVWTDKVKLSDLRFPNLDGQIIALDDPQFAGKCRIIEVFGSWCPNCHDAGVYLSELDKKYRDQGLSILGLAFELTGDFERDANQVRRFIKRNETQYPILIAGTSDKQLASDVLQVLDQVRSYPTMIFLDGAGNVKAIYTGFSGPATGPAYDKLKRQFEKIISETLGL